MKTLRAAYSLAILSFPIIGCELATETEPDDRTSTAQQQIVSTTTPKYTAAQSGSMPSLNVDGGTAPAAAYNTSADYAHEGQFSNYQNLNAAPTTNQSSASAWVTAATSDPLAANVGAFSTYLNQAYQSATAANSIYDTPTDETPDFRLATWTPMRARWLRSQWAFGNCGALPCTRETEFSYPDPRPLSDTRNRGARLYCSAREAQVAQNGAVQSMGKIEVGAFDLLGLVRVVPLKVEPMVTLLMDDNSKRTGAVSGQQAPNDGAQAFAIPMGFGTRVSVFGIEMAEARYPVVMLSGDSEVATRSDYRRVKDSNLCFPPGSPCGSFKYSKTWGSTTHTDAIYTGYGSKVQQLPDIPLLSLGFATVSLGVKLTQGYGLPSFLNDRAVARQSPWLSARNDGSYFLYDSREFDTRALKWNDNIAGYTADEETKVLAAFGPLGNTRIEQDDDHHANFKSSFGLDVAVKIPTGVSLGPIEVSLTPSGTIGGQANQRHDLRDSINLQDYSHSIPVGSDTLDYYHSYADVAVRPSTDASITLSLGVNLKMKADVYFGEITILNTDIIKSGSQTLADWNSEDNDAWTESSALRMGYSDDSSTNLKQPLRAKSHNVNRSLY